VLPVLPVLPLLPPHFKKGKPQLHFLFDFDRGFVLDVDMFFLDLCFNLVLIFKFFFDGI
jgi:hypothetical protein